MTRLAVLLAALTWQIAVAQPRLVPWTEQASELGLGYPVPIPADMPLPFDGFRSYAALHSRHQDLMLTSGVVHGSIVGTTFRQRDIWAYRMGDSDTLTATGLPEPAMMTQGGIHAREWQSPEVLTGIMEKLVSERDDDFIVSYLLENTNIVLLPVLNIDGFLQTQRFPRDNYLDSDPNSPRSSPRDGRMRRKNMRAADEDLATIGDHLLGVDLNRNNPPYWASGNRNTPDTASLIHHGPGAHSEGATQAMVVAAKLGPDDRLRMYTDVHSFQRVFFSVLTGNPRRDAIQTDLLSDFSAFHATLPGNKIYLDRPGGPGVGIGSTDEYFALTYQIPSWTLEIEPSGDGGVDYGGLGSNGHDGFILPESEIRRVRENLAASFALAYYHQAGPPSITAVRWVDQTTGAIVVDAQWDVLPSGARSLYRNIIQPLQLDRDYLLWIAYDKPMRWREDGQVIALPGQSQSVLEMRADIEVDGTRLTAEVGESQWLATHGGAPNGYYRYRDDSYTMAVSLPAMDNADLVGAEVTANLNIRTADLQGLLIDADPSTPVDWRDGHWVGYQDANGVDGDSGGQDTTVVFPVSAAKLAEPFVIQAATSAAWYDIDHDGEGFLVQILDSARAVIYWFTYDEGGRQRWFIGEGRVRGNEIAVDELLVARGGIFGETFDPNDVVLSKVGNASFVWHSCEQGNMRHNVAIRNQRQRLDRLAGVFELGCGTPPPAANAGFLSGSWYDPALRGQGFVIQQLSPERAIVYWFTYDDQGAQAWIFGDGEISDGRLVVNDALISQGGIFGDAFDPQTVRLSSWGRIEFDLGCNDGRVDYQSNLEAYGQGSQSLVRLTQLDGLDCSQ